MRTSFLGAVLLAAIGCSSDANVSWPELHPTKGVVKTGGKAVAGGSIQLRSEDPAGADYLVTGDVDAAGTFSLSTAHARDKKGDRKAGVPAGKYKVTYHPPMADQTAGQPPQPVTLPTPLTVNPGDNDLAIDLPTKK